MAFFILPTSGPRTYRGKYPARARSVSSGATGLHVELNDGTRLWRYRNGVTLPRCGDDFGARRDAAHQMTPEQYATLTEAAALLRTRADIAGHGRRARLESDVRAMLESIVPADAEAEAAARSEACLVLENETPAPVTLSERAGIAVERTQSDNGASLSPAPMADLTPTWSGMLPAMRALIENGSAEGRAVAWQELGRMAALADDRNRMARIDAAADIPDALWRLAMVCSETRALLAVDGMAGEESRAALAGAYAALEARRMASEAETISGKAS